MFAVRQLLPGLLLVLGAAHAGDTLHVCRQPGGQLLGLGDTLCRIKVPYRYESIEPFTSDAVAIVAVPRSWGGPGKGLIDRSGKEILPPIYDELVLGAGGQVVASKEDPSCPFHPAPTLDMLFDLQGRPQLREPLADVGFFRQGLARAMPLPSGDRRCSRPNKQYQGERQPRGYIDRTGQFVIDVRFDEAADFAPNGLAAVRIDRHWGFIDNQGRMTIPAQYDDVLYVSDDDFPDFARRGFIEGSPARVEQRDLVSLIDASGKTVGQGGWMKISVFDQIGLARVIAQGDAHRYGLVGLIDKQGKLLVTPTYLTIEPFVNGYAAVLSVNHLWGFIDTSGRVAVRPMFAEVGTFSRHGLAKVLLHPGRDPADRSIRSMGYGYIDSHGNVVIDKDDYDGVDAFQDALDEPVVRVSKGGGTGYLDTHGKLALGWFEAGTKFGTDGLAVVKVGGKFGFIDRHGRFVVMPTYEDARLFDGDIAVVLRNGKWGAIDHAGRTVVPFEFERLSGFGGDAMALGQRDGTEVGVDRRGKSFALPPLGPLRGVTLDDH